MKSAKRGSKRDHTHKRMTHGCMTHTDTLSQCRVRHYHECGSTRENVTYEGVLFTEPESVSEGEVENSENKVKVLGVLCRSSDMARSKRWNEYFMESTTLATHERVTNQCKVLCGHTIHVCTCNVTRCFVHILWRFLHHEFQTLFGFCQTRIRNGPIHQCLLLNQFLLTSR